MQAAASAGETVTRPELDAALAALKADLLERIAESENRTVERIAELENRIAELENRIAGVENRTVERFAETERRLDARMTALVWRLFGGAVAVAGLAVAALKYLP